MRKTSKIFSVLLALSMSFAVSLTACKEDGGESSSSLESSSVEQSASVTLDKTQVTVCVDDDFYLTATASGGIVSWSSSDKEIATVSSNGRVLAKKEGTVIITASIGDAFASCVVTIVSASGVEGAEIQTDATSYFLSMSDGAAKTIVAEYVVDNGETQEAQTGKTFQYQSLNEEVVTVSADGKITPVALGTTEIVISCEGLTAFVTADVYTDGISTPAEWMEVIKNSCVMPDTPETDKRYYLENDIDFDGIEYDIGGVARGSSSNTVEQGGNIYHFGSEINGNFHSVKNITLWKDDAELNPEKDQSIFGRTIGATISNIAFENVVFTSANSYGLCSIMMHHTSIGQMKYNTFTNVFADFLYAYEVKDGVKGNSATGVTAKAYGAVLKDVFVRMRSANGTNLKEQYNHVYGFSYAEWVWYGGSLTNVLTFVEDVPEGEAEFLNEAAGDQNWKHAKQNCYAVSTVMQAAYHAQLILDGDVWEFYPDAVPTFKMKK